MTLLQGFKPLQGFNPASIIQPGSDFMYFMSFYNFIVCREQRCPKKIYLKRIIS